MPRLKKDLTSDRIFGRGSTQVRIPELSKQTKIAVSTLRGWKSHPEHMTLYGFARIARSTSMTDEQVLKVIRGIK